MDSLEKCATLFRPQKESIGKTYTYVIDIGEQRPFLSDLCWNLPNFTNLEAVKTAAHKLVGKHNFAAFTVESERGGNCEREIFSVDIKQLYNFICLSFTGTSFLYRMVRRIVGALAEIGCEKAESSLISNALTAAKNGDSLIDLDIKTAPPQGLYLMEVYYDQIPDFFDVEKLPFI